MKIKNLHPKSSSTHTEPLRGEEAVELYTAEIVRKIAALSEQAVLLKGEIGESRQLLDEIQEDQTNGAADQPSSGSRKIKI